MIVICDKGVPGTGRVAAGVQYRDLGREARGRSAITLEQHCDVFAVRRKAARDDGVLAGVRTP
jgi:hypothetical protein